MKKIATIVTILVALSLVFKWSPSTLLPAPDATPSLRTKMVSRSVAMVSEEDAVLSAINALEELPKDAGYVLEHPLYSVDYSPEGVVFQPRSGGPKWHWQLQHAGTADRNFLVADTTMPRAGRRKSVEFHRAGFVERYLSELDHIEQQFVLKSAPALGADENFVIRGDVRGGGEFEEYAQGWLWRDPASGVVTSLGQVTVFDADGETLPATMTASAKGTEIVVDGAALLAANYPVTVDPEIGVNDFLISHSSVDGNLKDYASTDPAVAFNPISETFLVVWIGVDSALDYRIQGKVIDARSGQPITGVLTLDDSPVGHDVATPAIAVDPVGGGALVVWSSLSASSSGIVGQRLSANGEQVGGDFAVSAVGPESPKASQPEVVFNSAAGEDGRYLVVWIGRDEPTIGFDKQLWSRLVGTDGGFQSPENPLSVMPGISDPSVAANTNNGEFLLTFSGQPAGFDDTIFGLRLGSGGTAVAAVPSQIQTNVSSPDSVLRGHSPEVVFNPVDEEYLIVWNSVLTSSTATINSTTCQTVTPTGFPKLASDLTILETSFRTLLSITYRVHEGDYLVNWLSDPTTSRGAEVFARTLAPLTAMPLTEPQRITYSGPEGAGQHLYHAGAHATATGLIDGEQVTCLVWEANTPGNERLLAEHRGEILGQIFEPGSGVALLEKSLPKRLSDSSLSGGIQQHTFDPDIAYSSARDMYLVVWSQLDDDSGLSKIYYQFIGGDGNARYLENRPVTAGSFIHLDEFNPKVAWGSGNDHFLIAYEGRDNTPGDINGEREIYSVHFDLPPGFGKQPTRISHMGPDDDGSYTATDPAVAYNSDADQFLVIWRADDDGLDRGQGDFEIHGQRLDADAIEIGADDFKISRLQPIVGSGFPFNHPMFSAGPPEITYSPATGNFHIAYGGVDLIDGQSVTGVFRSTVSGTSPIHFGRSDLISQGTFTTPRVDLAADPGTGRYLVVWEDSSAIRAQMIDGVSDTHDSGPFDVAIGVGVTDPSVVYGCVTDEFFVTWSDGLEVIGTNINYEDGFIGDGLQLSDMGPTGSFDFEASAPAVALGPDGERMVVWSGDDDREHLTEGISQIFGQRVAREESPLEINIELVTEGVVIRLKGEPGEVYQLFGSSDLEDWNEIGTPTAAPANGEITFTVLNSSIEGDRYFFRAAPLAPR